MHRTSARPLGPPGLDTHAKSAIGPTMDVWTPSQERRGLCQEPDTALGCEPKICRQNLAAAFCRFRSRISALDNRWSIFSAHQPRRLNPTTRPQGHDGSTDLESRSTTSFLLVSRSHMANRDRGAAPVTPRKQGRAFGAHGCQVLSVEVLEKYLPPARWLPFPFRPQPARPRRARCWTSVDLHF